MRALNALPNKHPSARAIAVPADNSRMDELDRLVDEVRKTTDHVDILMANAGATWGEKFDTHPEHAFSKVMDLNVKSVFYCVQKCVLSTPPCIWLYANTVRKGSLPSLLQKHPLTRHRA